MTVANGQDGLPEKDTCLLQDSGHTKKGNSAKNTVASTIIQIVELFCHVKKFQSCFETANDLT